MAKHNTIVSRVTLIKTEHVHVLSAGERLHSKSVLENIHTHTQGDIYTDAYCSCVCKQESKKQLSTNV